MRHTIRLFALALFVGGFVCLAMPGIAQAHAIPQTYAPAPNAALKASPTNVHIRFSEHLDPRLSTIVVINPSNQEVDDRNCAVSADGYSMTVTLPLLRAGTYVVAWKTHSADDSHIAGGSYLFHIARADGTVPPLTGPLPSGSIVGGGGADSSPIDPITLIGTLIRWVGLAALTLFLGLVWWWRFILPRQTGLSAELRGTLMAQFRLVADLALETLIAVVIVEVEVQALLLGGGTQSLISIPLLTSILFQNRFGHYFLLCIALSAIGILALDVPRMRTWLVGHYMKWIVPLFGLALALAFEYSGHGGAVTTWWGPAIDAVHLLANGVWLGGLFVLTLIILPALATRSSEERMNFVIADLPAFSRSALIAVAVLLLSGPLNATPRMTGISQLWTTPYGLVLTGKIAIFIIMMAISAYHAFVLRPKLVAIQQGKMAPVATSWTSPRSIMQEFMALVRPGNDESIPLVHTGGTIAIAIEETPRAGLLTRDILRWIHIETILGVGILGCVAFLGPLAGTLAYGPAKGASFGAIGGTQHLTQVVDSLTVELTVNPGHFGTNTFTVVVTNPDHSPASNGTVFLTTTLVEMDMGTNTINLQPGKKPGTYTGPGELPMAGHWSTVVVIRTQQDPSKLHRATFTIGVSY
jgi:copper transport protein